MTKKPETTNGERVVQPADLVPRPGDDKKTPDDVKYIDTASKDSGKNPAIPADGEFAIHERPANCVWEDQDTRPSTLHWYSNYNNTTYCGDDHFWTSNWVSYETVGGTCSDGCKKFRVRYR